MSKRNFLKDFDLRLQSALVAGEGVDVFEPMLIPENLDDGHNVAYRFGKLHDTLESVSVAEAAKSVWMPLVHYLKNAIVPKFGKLYLGYQCLVVLKKTGGDVDQRFGSLFVDTPSSEFWKKGFPKYIINAIPPSSIFLGTKKSEKKKPERIAFWVAFNRQGKRRFSLKDAGLDAVYDFYVNGKDVVNPIETDYECNTVAKSWRYVGKEIDKATDDLLTNVVKDSGDVIKVYRYLEFTCKTLWALLRNRCHEEKTEMNGFGLLFLLSNSQNPRSGLLLPFADGDLSSCDIVGLAGKCARLCGGCIEAYLRELEGREHSQHELYKLHVANTQAAIGSIMSRNGSHNIGSHVLAALADNVSTMPDDKVLYQYIQHRMDYIATTTTDFPAWRQPTMFVGTMMKTFLSQRHLLDNIAGSEGLKAWRFQGRMANKRKDAATIKFHIRKIEDGDAQELLRYNCDGGNMCLDGDVSLAIPGGTVGQHAFFTIVENIIRNAAKHDWSSPPSRTRRFKFQGNKIVGNLEVFIDFRDIPEEGNVEFTIFTNMSDADEKIITAKGKSTLLVSLEKAISTPFIDEESRLRKENWGIAEMKISAGYLQGREPGVIGGLSSASLKADADDAKFGKNIIGPVRVPMKRINHLGYTFKIPKARTLLVVVKENPKNFDAEKAKAFAKYGVYVKNESETGSDNADNAFEFVLLDSFDKDKLRWRLPFRIVCVRPEGCCEKNRNHVADFKMFNLNVDCADKIAEKLVESEDVEKSANELIEQVCASWVKYLKGVRALGPLLNLEVATEIAQDNNHSGQSLINAAAAVRFVFEEGMGKAIESYNRLQKRFAITASNMAWKETRTAIKFIIKHGDEIDSAVSQSDAGIRPLLIKQVSIWLRDCDKDKIQGVWAYITEMQKGSSQADAADEKYANHPFKLFIDYLGEVCKQAKGYLGQYAEEIATLPKGFSADKKTTGTNARIEFWEAAGLNICVGRSGPPGCQTLKYYRHYTPRVSRNPSDKNPPRFVIDPFGGTNDQYIEPLSGTQSYLTQLQSLYDADSMCAGKTARRLLQTKLVECALLRVLIIDERVSRFVSNHSDLTLATFSLMNISVADDKSVTDELESSEHKQRQFQCPCEDEQVKYTQRGLVQIDAQGIDDLRNAIVGGDICEIKTWRDRHLVFKDKFDVLIVHQGILDKWFKGVVNDRDKMVLLYDSLKKVFPYVVITTGRGTPANIPNMARVLPFSTIETTLFRKYPEKLVLTDAIMNILPVKKVDLAIEES